MTKFVGKLVKITREHGDTSPTLGRVINHTEVTPSKDFLVVEFLDKSSDVFVGFCRNWEETVDRFAIKSISFLQDDDAVYADDPIITIMDKRTGEIKEIETCCIRIDWDAVSLDYKGEEVEIFLEEKLFSYGKQI